MIGIDFKKFYEEEMDIKVNLGLLTTEMEFDENFERMWQYYLAYSEAGFRARHLDVWQLGFEKL